MTFGISGVLGALLLRISGIPGRGPSEVTRRQPGAARRARPAIRSRGHRGGRAAPPDPGTMGRRRAAWTGRGSPPTPASRQPPPLRNEAGHHPPASLKRRGTARAAHAVPPDGAATEGGQNQGRVLAIHTERKTAREKGKYAGIEPASSEVTSKCHNHFASPRPLQP